MALVKEQRVSLILLILSAIGVTLSGPLILEWIPTSIGPFWNFGEPWTTIGGYLDIIGGLFQFFWIYIMFKEGIFTQPVLKSKIKDYYIKMAFICLIGLIADPLGGLLAIAAQLGLYTSLVNIYKNKD